MKRILLPILASVVPSTLFAHGEGAHGHMHPHGGELLFAVLVLVASAALWRKYRPRKSTAK